MPSIELKTEVRIVADLIARAGQASALQAELLKMIGPSNSEPGCRQYELHEDREHPDHFVFIERWADAAAVDFHTKTPHYLALGPAIASLLERPVKLTKLKMIG